MWQRGEKVRIEGYIHPFGLVAVNERGPLVPVIVSSAKGPVVHRLRLERLTLCNESGTWEAPLRAFLKSPAGKAVRSPSQFRGRPRPASNTPVRGLPANRRHGVRLIP